MCGDAGATGLFKDGLGAGYFMGKAAAKAAVFQGLERLIFGGNTIRDTKVSLLTISMVLFCMP